MANSVFHSLNDKQLDIVRRLLKKAPKKRLAWKEAVKAHAQDIKRYMLSEIFTKLGRVETGDIVENQFVQLKFHCKMENAL